MPELPEVEIIKLGLQKKIVELTIKKVEILSPRSFLGDSEKASGKKVLNIWRKAKILGVELDSSFWGAKRHQNLKRDSGQARMTLLFHLKMSGQLILVSSKDSRFIGGHPTKDMVGELPNKSTRVIFTFNDGSKLYFNDQRRFGWIKVMENGKLKMENFLGNLGPEPLEEEFTWEVLKNNLLRHKTIPVKVALLDQTVVSGLGNIYANEACFAAGINPVVKVVTLTDKQFQALYRGVVRVLRDGITYGGSSRAHFVDAEGRKGYFLDYAKVYWRDKYPCKVCKTIIKKVQLGGRGTYFCPACQKG